MVRKFRLGKNVPRHDVRTLRFARYTAALTAPPSSEYWYKGVSSFPMDGNDSVGDCTIAGAAHLIENWTYNAAPPAPEVFSTNDCLDDYYALTGGPDSGLDLLTVLKQWQGTGLAWGGSAAGWFARTFCKKFQSGGKEDKITAYTALQAGNALEAQQAVWLFGGAYIGLELPDFAVSGDMLATPWVVPPGGAVGNAAPNPNNGHCVAGVGYTEDVLYVVTWGTVKAMSWEFYSAYSDEAYAVVSQDWIGAGLSPSGFDMQQLESDLQLVES